MGNALVDNCGAQFGQSVDVFFTSAEVTTFLRVGEQPPSRVAVVAIVLGGVDASLSCDTVSTSGRILKAKAFNVVAHRSHRGRGGSPCESATDDENLVFVTIVGPHQTQMVFVVGPHVFDRSLRQFRVESQHDFVLKIVLRKIALRI